MRHAMRTAFGFLPGILAVLACCTAAAFADDGALDPTFGNGGKVILPASSEGSGPSSLVATDVAVQSAGRTIVAGNDDANDCSVAALKDNGDLDTGFSNGNGFAAGFSGYGACAYNGVAVRSD